MYFFHMDPTLVSDNFAVPLDSPSTDLPSFSQHSLFFYVFICGLLIPDSIVHYDTFKLHVPSSHSLPSLKTKHAKFHVFSAFD